MLKTSYLQLVILFLFLSVLSASGQTKTKKEMEEDAYNALNDEDYAAAYDKFDELNAKYPKEFNYKLNLGIAALRNPERKERALDIFTELKKEYPKFIDVDFFLGRAYHANYKFDEAITILEAFVKDNSSSIKKETKLLVEEAKITIANCNNGKQLISGKIIADIVNIGSPINTDEEQYVPVITTDESIMFFTYSGKQSKGGKLNSNLEPDAIEGRYNEDVYVAYKRPDNKYAEPIGIDAINTKGNDAAIAISPNGHTLFTFYSDAKNSGDIAMSKLIGDEFTKPELLNTNINTDSWEGSCSISADGRYLYFASERPGGFGGRDIWISEQLNGDWGPAKNLGPNVNTKYDDDAPFIHPDGITMFFSSKGHLSIGGYDIM
ncbi:MAG: PD40 domain-containing protein, partial [Bacteroidetes bacterium]|nr:PD40 domain-containing protein [Bacteroidota bacterium]